MYRRGPSKSTPANVQCQKCLKRGHYSYECKVSGQERPYVSRPSRTQQLLNPKLVPKLASDAIDAVQKTKGLADQELAKREAERARGRASEQEDTDYYDVSKRARSASYDSVSTISTRAPPSPARRRVSLSPPRPTGATRSPSPIRESARRRRPSDSGSDYERRNSPSPEARNRSTRSPTPARRPTRSSSRDDSLPRGRFDLEEQPATHRHGDRRRGRYSKSPSRSPPPESRRGFRSRSPQGHWRPARSPAGYDDHDRPTGPRRQHGTEQRGGAPRRDAKERSLSPFSKRLALTQAMNAGR
ncbi:zinc knuckle-domain-containing protein [Nemania serpens]|nr:zinc knuckle-domain-containing protein [Nemania serpens]